MAWTDEEIRKLIDAYRTRRMSDEQQAEFERMVESGEIKLPSGVSVQSVALQEEIPAMGREYPPIPEAPTEGPPTTAGGLAAGWTREAGPLLASTLTGAAIGSLVPVPGVGTAVGGAAGAGFYGLSQTIDLVNEIAGTQFNSPYQFFQWVFDKMGIERPDSKAELLNQRIAQITSSAASVPGLAKTAAGVVTKPAVRGIVGALAEQPATQIVAGATGATAGELAREEAARWRIGPEGQKTAALVFSLFGGALGAKAMGWMRGTYVPRDPAELADLKQAIAQAEEIGTNLKTMDVIPPKGRAGQSLRQFGAQIPGGPKAEYEEQARAINTAIKNYVEKYVGPQSSDEITTAIVKIIDDEHSAMLNRLTVEKTQILNQAAAGRDWEVPTHNTMVAIGKKIRELRRNPNQENLEIADDLEVWREYFGERRNILDLEDTRKAMFNTFKADNKKQIRAKGTKIISDIYYGKLRPDMRNYIERKLGAKTADKWVETDTELAEMVGDLDASAFKRVLQSADITPEKIRGVIFGRIPSDIERLTKYIPKEHEGKIRNAVIAESAERSMEPRGPAGRMIILPSKFAEHLYRLSRQANVALSATDKKQAAGLIRTINASKFSEQFGEAGLPKGQVSIPTMLWLGARAGVAGIAGAMQLGRFVKWYESPKIRNMLIHVGKLKPGSPEEERLVKRVLASFLETFSPKYGEQQQ